MIQRLPSCACDGGCPLCAPIQRRLEVTPLVQRQVDEEENLLQTKSANLSTAESTRRVASMINRRNGSGQLLTNSVRNYFEPRFGRDFSEVRLHSDSQAYETARAFKARAFTVGNNIVFGAGQYQPETRQGKQLLAHELTHVVQQSRGDLRVSRSGYEGGGDSVSRAPWYDGVKATIDHVDPPVNTQGISTWAGIDNGGQGGLKWLQGGWLKYRGDTAKIYWEYTDKNGTWAKGYDSAPALSETYEVRHEGSEAVWKHGSTVYKRVNWDKFNTIHFQRAVYTAEMHQPPGDHTPGRVSNKNDFLNCETRRAGRSYAAARLGTTFDSAPHGNMQRQRGNNFRIWDSRDP